VTPIIYWYNVHYEQVAQWSGHHQLDTHLQSLTASLRDVLSMAWEYGKSTNQGDRNVFI
jgi:hypothetical protein